MFPHPRWRWSWAVAAVAAAGLGLPAAQSRDDAPKAAPEQMAEAQAWQQHQATAEAAVTFWTAFLQFRHGATNDKQFDAAGDPGGTLRARILCVVRAISWVESRHGTGAGASAARDPMQCGNPADTWWKELSGQTPAAMQDRFIGGPGAMNYNAADLPAAAAAQAGFPAAAKLSQLADKAKGHNDPNFTAAMSYYWGVAYFVHRTNTNPDLPDANKRTYKFGDCSLDRLKKGAVKYNGGGDPQYGTKITSAITLIGCGS